MNLNHLSDDQLISKTKLLAKQERELLTEVLHHLSEVDRRRLFSVLKYKSLFDYAVRELGYSDDQAYRRVKAAQLLQQLPEIEHKIESGSLTLANLSVAASAIRMSSTKKQRTVEVRKIVELVEGKSKREAESTLIKEEILESQEMRSEKVRHLGENIEIRITLSKEMLGTIQQLKSLMAHSDPNITTSELFKRLCDEKVNSLIARRRGVKPGKAQKCENLNKMNGEQVFGTDQKFKSDKKVSKRAIRRIIWSKSNLKCENCESQHALEVDHIFPKAKGGGDESNNQRILCRNCNQRSAIEHFGQQTMDGYLNFT